MIGKHDMHITIDQYTRNKGCHMCACVRARSKKRFPEEFRSELSRRQYWD